jgi:hypothetical protein
MASVLGPIARIGLSGARIAARAGARAAPRAFALASRTRTQSTLHTTGREFQRYVIRRAAARAGVTRSTGMSVQQELRALARMEGRSVDLPRAGNYPDLGRTLGNMGYTAEEGHAIMDQLQRNNGYLLRMRTSDDGRRFYTVLEHSTRISEDTALRWAQGESAWLASEEGVAWAGANPEAAAQLRSFYIQLVPEAVESSPLWEVMPEVDPYAADGAAVTGEGTSQYMQRIMLRAPTWEEFQRLFPNVAFTATGMTIDRLTQLALESGALRDAGSREGELRPYDPDVIGQIHGEGVVMDPGIMQLRRENRMKKLYQKFLNTRKANAAMEADRKYAEKLAAQVNAIGDMSGQVGQTSKEEADRMDPYRNFIPDGKGGYTRKQQSRPTNPEGGTEFGGAMPKGFKFYTPPKTTYVPGAVGGAGGDDWLNTVRADVERDRESDPTATGTAGGVGQQSGRFMDTRQSAFRMFSQPGTSRGYDRSGRYYEKVAFGIPEPAMDPVSHILSYRKVKGHGGWAPPPPREFDPRHLYL